MTDIAEFLLARIAEDEADARISQANYAGITIDFPHGAWNEARVLAECEAKRRIVAFYLGSRDALASMPDGPDPQQMLKRMVGEAINESHADALKPLALPYADHPDYRQEWAL